jgi:hypothetical protein
MNSSPSEDEDLHRVQRDEPLPRFVESATPPEQDGKKASESNPPAPSSGRFTFVASLLLIALAFSIGLSYFFQPRSSNRSGRVPSNGAAETNLIESSAAVPLGPETFHVSAISLSGQPFAVVNGKSVSEGDSLVVATSSGPVTARVTKIEEGVVHFEAAGRSIDATSEAVAQKTAP